MPTMWRAAWFLGLWLVLAGADPSDLPAAALAVVAATWTSLHLLPPSGARVSPVAMALLVPRFLRQSVVAGVDVARRALDPQVPADALRFVTEWNERQAQRAPLLFSPTIGAAITAQYWYLWVRCPGCCCTQSVDLRRLDWHPDAW